MESLQLFAHKHALNIIIIDDIFCCTNVIIELHVCVLSEDIHCSKKL